MTAGARAMIAAASVHLQVIHGPAPDQRQQQRPPGGIGQQAAQVGELADRTPVQADDDVAALHARRDRPRSG